MKARQPELLAFREDDGTVVFASDPPVGYKGAAPRRTGRIGRRDRRTASRTSVGAALAAALRQKEVRMRK